MLRLKATKTSLYKLVHLYEALPPMRRAEFTKAPRTPDYWLEWRDANGLWCKAFFSTCLGKPLLSIEKREYDNSLVSRQVYNLDHKDLLERDMVEEFTTAMERRRANGKA